MTQQSATEPEGGSVTQAKPALQRHFPPGEVGVGPGAVTSVRYRDVVSGISAEVAGLRGGCGGADLSFN